VSLSMAHGFGSTLEPGREHRMTIVRAVAVSCPECREWRISPVTVSTTIFDLRQWSDGYAAHSLDSGPPSLLRACECGAIFAVHKTERREISRDIVPVGAVSAIALHEAEFLVAERGPFEPDIELPLRKLAWWHSNQDQRGTARARDELPRPLAYRPDWMPQPAVGVRFSPTDHRSNIIRIVELLQSNADSDWMLVGDARRQLGEFEAAISAYERMPSALTGWRKHLIKKASRRESTVAELTRIAEQSILARIFDRRARKTIYTAAWASGSAMSRFGRRNLGD